MKFVLVMILAILYFANSTKLTREGGCYGGGAGGYCGGRNECAGGDISCDGSGS
jgi:hypothetical protein